MRQTVAVKPEEGLVTETGVGLANTPLFAALDDDATALRRLGSVLTEHEVYSRRLQVQQMHVPGGAPPLPDLGILWDTSQLGEADDGAVVSRLADAEHQLSSYRRSLHLRLDAATGELIARYHDEPSLALSALPLARDTGRERAAGMA